MIAVRSGALIHSLVLVGLVQHKKQKQKAKEFVENFTLLVTEILKMRMFKLCILLLLVSVHTSPRLTCSAHHPLFTACDRHLGASAVPLPCFSSSLLTMPRTEEYCRAWAMPKPWSHQILLCLRPYALITAITATARMILRVLTHSCSSWQ